MQSTQILSKTSEKILDLFHQEFLRAQQTYQHEIQGKAVESITHYESINLADYLKLMKELLKEQTIDSSDLAETLLPQTLLQKKLESIDENSQLKANFPSGYKIQLALIPFTYYSHPMNSEELKEGLHLTELIRKNEEDSKSYGFSQFPGMVHKLFPKELQSCQFIVPNYEKAGLFEVTQNDRERLKESYTQAFQKLHQIIKQEKNYH